MRRALTAKTVNPEVVLVEAGQAADADTAHVVPIGVQALAHYHRPHQPSAAMTRCSTATSSSPTKHEPTTTSTVRRAGSLQSQR